MSREIDAEVAEKVMGMTRCCVGCDGSGRCYMIDTDGSVWLHGGMVFWSPSTDIAAAWQVVEKMGETHWPHIKKPARSMSDDEHWRVSFHSKAGPQPFASANDKSVCMAISLAALAAHKARQAGGTKA